MDRIKEPSTWAGLALVAQGIAELLTSKFSSPSGWMSVVGGLGAIIRRENAG